MEGKKSPRVALLGCGHRGKEMAALFCKLSGAEMSAFVDDVSAARNDAAATTNVPTFSYEEFWGTQVYHKETDLVMIASVNNLHAGQIVRSLADGKYVFCEKPLFTTWDDLEVKVIRLNSERFCSGFVLRHSPFYQTIKDQLSNIGTIQSISASDFLHYGHGSLIFGGAWRHDPTLSGGHIVEKLVHVIDLLVWYIDEPIDAVCGYRGPDIWTHGNRFLADDWIRISNNELLLDGYRTHDSTHPFDHGKLAYIVESSGVLSLRFNGGATAALHFNTACPNSRREFTIIGTTGMIQAVWSPTESSIKITTCGVGTKTMEGRPGKTATFDFKPVGCHGGGDEFIMRSLADTVVNGDAPNPSVEESLRTMKATIDAQVALV